MLIDLAIPGLRSEFVDFLHEIGLAADDSPSGVAVHAPGARTAREERLAITDALARWSRHSPAARVVVLDLI